MLQRAVVRRTAVRARGGTLHWRSLTGSNARCLRAAARTLEASGLWGASAGHGRAMVVAGVARRSFAAMPGGPLETYLAMKDAGQIQPDPRQEVTMGKLDELAKRVSNYSPSLAPAAKKPATPQKSGGGGIFSFFGGGGQPAPSEKKEPEKLVPQGPRGLYVWGGTGTGKTFMMDIFHDKVPVERKKRIHFHEWMIDVHDRLHRRQKGSSAKKDTSADDLVQQVAVEMLSEAWLLCFDEFQVTHISDAIILKRIFSVLFERGAVVVATSNRPPEDLYLNGLNRQLFLPFIPMLKDFCEVHAIGAEVDYRMISQEGEDDRVYIHPNGPSEAKLLENRFYRLCQNQVLTGMQLETQGRKIVVPKAAMNTNVAWFPFKDLCDRPLGAADYLAIGTAFHTVFMPDIPKLTLQERDQIRRFITFIDSMYERKIKFVCTAADDPIQLFKVSEEEKKTSSFDEVFAWDRTVSRLMEMQSAKYLSDAARSLDADQFLGQYKLSALTDDDMREMWHRYDADDSGELDMAELRSLLEDLLEKQMGHRSLSDDVFESCKAAIDLNKDGVISFEEFTKYLGDYTMVRSTMKL